MDGNHDHHHGQPERPPLGNLSPNTRSPLPLADVLKKKPLMGSPLKRSFTAAVEGDRGFKYLKKRKLSADESIDQETVGHNAYGDRSLPLQTDPIDMDDTYNSPENCEGMPTPTEPNTPSDDSESDRRQDSSVERASFSSLINYDPSSQPPNGHRPLQNFTPSSAAKSAEMLSLRLQVAMYKVRTNQISKSFEELSPLDEDKPKSRQDLIEDAVAQLRREAQECQPLHDRPVARLQSGFPIFQPTFPSRGITQSEPLLSSPPGSRLVPGAHLTESLHTPHAVRTAVDYLTKTPLSRGKGTPCDKDLSSSVVRGRVAEGLLGLRNAI